MDLRHYDEGNWRELLGRRPATDDGLPQIRPRRTAFGSSTATKEYGLVPVVDHLDMLIEPSDYKEVVATCHAKKIFAMYHQERAAWAKAGWMQSSYGFCWAYGASASVMDARAYEGQPVVRLAPFSLGWLVGWRNQGFFLDATIRAIGQRGIASAEYVPEYSLRPETFRAGWEQDALNYRMAEWWDTDRTNSADMIRQCLSILATGKPLYVAYNWWGHALECVGMTWDETQPNNVRWVLRNSHGENEYITLSGSRGVPDEAYGPRKATFPA